MNINFRERIKRFCLENNIEYHEETYINPFDSLFVNYHALLRTNREIEIFRQNWREYNVHIDGKIITVTASQFREVYEIIKKELLNDK